MSRSEADLRQKLKALAKEWDAWANTGVDCASALETCADELTDLLASHEEREGEDVNPLAEMEAIRDGEPSALYPTISRGTLDRWIDCLRRLRPHTDREPDGWLWGRRDDDLDGYGIAWDREFAERHWHRADLMFRPVYIGPPVQPEEGT